MNKKKWSCWLLLSGVLVLAVAVLHVGFDTFGSEITYPTRPIKLIVPWPPGGRTDIAARVWAPFLEKELGVPVIVTNIPGAGGVIGGTALIHSPPDGYTIGILSISLNLAQWTKVPPFKFDELEPVCMIFSTPMTLVVHRDAPWQTLKEYLDYARANPGAILHSASGVGTSQHIISAAFHRAAGVMVTFIPYDGDGPAALAVVTKEVHAGGSPMIALKPFLDAGEVRVLGISSAQRSPLYPDIPTFREQNVDFALESFDGIYVPKGTPEAVIEKLEAAFRRMSMNPDFVKAMADIYYEVSFMPRAQFKEYLAVTNALLEAVVTELGLKLVP